MKICEQITAKSALGSAGNVRSTYFREARMFVRIS